MNRTAKGFRSTISAMLPGLLLAAGSLPHALFAQSVSPAQALEEATKKLKQIEAVTGISPNEKAPAGDPCTLVPVASVKKIFPTAAASPERSRRLEQYGITECIWKSKDGRILLVVQESRADSDTRAHDEAAGISLGFVDPLKPAARASVRMEKFSALKVDNAAFIETADPARGILSSGAFMALVKGRQVVTLMAPELTHRDRSEALKAFETLGLATASTL